jgi:hypothetical protein
MRYRKIVAVIASLAVLFAFFIQCSGNNGSGNDARGSLYAGSETCMSCHQDIANSYQHTNHYKTSAPASAEELKKYTNVVSNNFYYGDSDMVSLQQKHDRYYQAHVVKGQTARSEQLDIAIGSAEKAQTYAYWRNGQLLQLPLTYFTATESWTNSPGYPIQKPYFDRVILSRCLECHASYVKKTDIKTGPLQMSEKLAPASIVFGIDCERCHGPAAKHVEFHLDNPRERQPSSIKSIKSLSRQQKLDMCASCHSGNDLDVQRSLFAFRPGDTLANFYYPHFGSGSAEPDVHGKQMQLLQSSKCFKLSTLTCMTCHDTHRPEENKREVLIAKCMACHQNSPHALQARTASKTCVDCHMPLQASKSLDFSNGTEKKSIRYLLRTHRIAIYPEANEMIQPATR